MDGRTPWRALRVDSRIGFYYLLPFPVVDPNAFHSRDVSTLCLDDRRVSGGNSEIDSLVSAIPTSHMVPHAPSTSPRPHLVGHDPKSSAYLYILYATSTAHPRFRTIPLTEM